MALLPDYQPILDKIADEVTLLTHQGKVADYIAPLASVSIEQFGIAVQTVNGHRFSAGAARQPFSIQSISKIFSLTMAIRLVGEALWDRVGREPSGTAFNSLVQLEREQGRPRNPFINAGALVVTDVLCGRFAHPELAVLQFIRGLLDIKGVDFDPIVAKSEAETGFRNAAMANFIKSFGNLEEPVENVLRCYFHNCALTMNCEELAAAALYLANQGTVPNASTRILSSQEVKRINAVLLTCGTYDAAGDFAYRVGLPAKSGVGGGIIAIVPGKLAVCVWSPGLDPTGNSLAGTMALERFTQLTGHSVF